MSNNMRTDLFEPLEKRVLMAAGDLDPTFSMDGRLTTDFNGTTDMPRVVAIDHKNRIVVAGDTDGGAGVARYNPDGTLDNTFGAGGDDGDGKVTHPVGRVLGLAVQPDGKILIAGRFDERRGGLNSPTAYYAYVARLQANGKLDTTFGNKGVARTFEVELFSDESIPSFNDIVLQPNGRIVAAGAFVRPNGRMDFGIARFTTSGKLDKSFSEDGIATANMGGNVDEQAEGVTLQENGRIVAVGTANRFESDQAMAVLRLNTNGTPDGDFSSDGRAFFTAGDNDEEPNDVAMLPTGQIVVVGSSRETIQGFVAVVNPEGTSFALLKDNIAEVFSNVAVQSDRKIVAVGTSRLNGEIRLQISRFRSSLTADAGFGTEGTVQLHAASSVRADFGHGVAVQPDGNIVAATDNFRLDNAFNDNFGVVRVRGNDDDEVVLSGRIFDDVNGNGLRNSGEPGVAGVRVFADLNLNGTFDPLIDNSVVTGADGKYMFPGLADGPIDIRIVKPKGFRYTGDKVFGINTVPGDKVNGLDFGLTKNVLIRGLVFRDLNDDKAFNEPDKVLKNYRVYNDVNNNNQLDDGEASTLTDEDGVFEFADLPGGDFVIRIQLKENHQPVIPSRKFLTLEDGQTSTNLRFGVKTIA